MRCAAPRTARSPLGVDDDVAGDRAAHDVQHEIDEPALAERADVDAVPDAAAQPSVVPATTSSRQSAGRGDGAAVDERVRPRRSRGARATSPTSGFTAPSVASDSAA